MTNCIDENETIVGKHQVDQIASLYETKETFLKLIHFYIACTEGEISLPETDVKYAMCANVINDNILKFPIMGKTLKYTSYSEI